MLRSSFEDGVRAGYDAIAGDYAERFRDELTENRLGRAMLGAFAEGVGDGLVADVGCGPGRVTAYLDGLGVDAFGIDLSPGMVAVARRDHPTLWFDVGTMTALDVADGALRGVVAWYSLIHIAPAELPGVFGELLRVLAPRGQLLVAFQVGDEVLQVSDVLGHPVTIDFQRLVPDRVVAQLEDAGFVVDAQLVRKPFPDEKTPQAHLLAHKP